MAPFWHQQSGSRTVPSPPQSVPLPEKTKRRSWWAERESSSPEFDRVYLYLETMKRQNQRFVTELESIKSSHENIRASLYGSTALDEIDEQHAQLGTRNIGHSLHEAESLSAGQDTTVSSPASFAEDADDALFVRPLSFTRSPIERPPTPRWSRRTSASSSSTMARIAEVPIESDAPDWI